ncbi:hypothetical protein HDK77DRAFT_491226 [Phyllosticta capitalensis]
MATPRRSSSVYSRDSEGNAYVAAHTHEASRSADHGTLFRPFCHFEDPSPQEAHQDDRSWDKVNGLVSACHLLVWADGFQFHIMHAVKLIQEEIRPLFREWPTSQSAETLEVKCQDLSTVLASWSRHNQLLSQGVSPAALEALPDLSTVESRHISQAAAEYQEKLRCLPTSKACEANLDVVYRLRAYFVEDVECIFKVPAAAADDNSLYAAQERSIRGSMSAIHNHLDDVLFSAEQVRDDAATAWKHFARMSNKIAETATAAKQNEEEKAVESTSRRLRALRHLKSFFSSAGSDHDTVRTEDGHNRLRKKSMSKPEGTPAISGPSDARHVQGLSGSSARSLLTVLPPAPLPELVQRQLEIRRHFARFEPQHLPDEHVEPQQSHKSMSRLGDDTSRSASRHRAVSIGDIRTETHTLAHYRSSRSPPIVTHGNGPVLTTLEQEVMEACAGGTTIGQSSGEEDPEALRARWRNHALRLLEGRLSDDEEDEGDDEQDEDYEEKEEAATQDCASRAEDAEKETEEEAKARRERDAEKALAILEGRYTGEEEEFPSQEEWLEQQLGMEHWTLD